MIGPEDIGDILYEDLRVFGIETFVKGVVPAVNVDAGRIPQGSLKAERIVIVPDETVTGRYWSRNFTEVNFCVPDLMINGVFMADRQRLKVLSREAVRFFEDWEPGVYDGSTYMYSMSSVGTERDAEIVCHFVNVKLLFNVLNVK
jgi:hypothetical protein